MTSLTFNPLQQTTLFNITVCKYSLSSKHHKFSHCCTSQHPPLHAIVKSISKSAVEHEVAKKILNLPKREESVSGNSSSKGREKRVERDSVKKLVKKVIDDKNGKRFTKNKEKIPRNSKLKPVKDNIRGTRSSENEFSSVVDGKKDGKSEKGDNIKGEKRGLKSKRDKVDMPETKLKVALDMCSKRGDVIGAIKLYESSLREGIKLGQHHYTVLLYLCSSAALGVVQPAKSGRGSRTLDVLDLSSGDPVSSSSSLDDGKFGVAEPKDKKLIKNRKAYINVDLAGLSCRNVFPMEMARDKLIDDFSDNGHDPSNGEVQSCNQDDYKIQVSEEIKEFALQKGFEIYVKMCADKVPMNEATLTAVARMAMSMGNGDMAFDMVKQMISLGINPRLRSYGPAITSFCNSGNINKAFAVEKHMLEHGVNPEEPELEALLRVSVAVGSSDKVYYLLHKLRTSVRKVSQSTADLIVKWFESSTATRVGKMKWDHRLIRKAIVNGGGGWHGQGWLGRGKWIVMHTTVGTDGFCKSCGEKLAIIDLDPIETQNFAESVASIAMQREKGSSFQNFQKWLDYYGPFEAVVDAANVGLFTQRKFRPSKVNLVVNGICKKLISKKWPLIVLHNRRLKGPKMDEQVNRAFVEKWKNADALYATPTGSNDDWYWLYAAIKFKCLIVTNDEMRDHTFQLLGNDFFPRWKERHQVRFSFSVAGPEFHMPPSCSVVIQESENSHWHIPIESEVNFEEERTWLCITRRKSQMQKQGPVLKLKGSRTFQQTRGNSRPADKAESKRESHKESNARSGSINESSRQEMYKNLRNTVSESVSSKDFITSVCRCRDAC